MRIRNYKRVFIYHSPQYPGYTCWVSLWNMPDESVMCQFTHATGPEHGRPHAPQEIQKHLDWPPGVNYQEYVQTGHEYDMTGLDIQSMHLRSQDFGIIWDQIGGDHFQTCVNGVTEAENALRDGTIIRAMYGEYLTYHDVPRDGYIQRSTDGSKTWGPPEVIYDNDDFIFWPRRIRQIRDGRVVIGGGLIRKHTGSTRSTWFDDATLAVFFSSDKGLTWNGPIDIVPREQKSKVKVCEELDFAELPNGDLLMIMRDILGRAPMQTQLSKKGDTWTSTGITNAPFPPSGHPELLATREGPILYLAITGVSWTTDGGKTWNALELPKPLNKSGWKEQGSPYYPQAIQMANGEILCIGHVGGDNGYGCVDQSIVGMRFFLNI